MPIVLAWDDWARTASLASALADVLSTWPTGVLIVASSDMTHYEPAHEAETKDAAALEAIAALDGEALLDVCARHRITMCGRVPAAAALETARRLGASATDVANLLHRSRKRLGAIIRSFLRDTVESEAEVEDEVRELFTSLE